LVGTALLVSVALSASGTRAAAGTGLPTFPCALAGVAEPARCGALEVPENLRRPNGRRLPIHVAVIPATSGKALADPIVLLMGGPGEDAISSAADYAAQFAQLRKDRDILLVDQRGTGKSAALHCELFSPESAADNLRSVFPPATVDKCKHRLEATADLTQYGYRYFANDLEQVRRALGYGPLNLFAGSYGTRAAQVYLRDYPRSVRTVYLGSVVPIDVETPLIFARAAQDASERMIHACEFDLPCHQAFPNLREEFRQVFERLATGNVRVGLPGYHDPVALDRGRVAEWVRSKLYRPSSAVTLPWFVHHAFQDDWTPIANDILAGAREADNDLSWGLLFSITCNEDVAFIPDQDVVPKSQGTFLGDYRVRQQQAACRHWPGYTLPQDYRKPIRSDIPTLFVTGDLDGGTPLWFTDRSAKGFSNHAIVVAHGQGHTEWNDCVADLYQQLVRTASVLGLDEKSCPAAPWPKFKI